MDVIKRPDSRLVVFVFSGCEGGREGKTFWHSYCFLAASWIFTDDWVLREDAWYVFLADAGAFVVPRQKIWIRSKENQQEPYCDVVLSFLSLVFLSFSLE